MSSNNSLNRFGHSHVNEQDVYVLNKKIKVEGDALDSIVENTSAEQSLEYYGIAMKDQGVINNGRLYRNNMVVARSLQFYTLSTQIAAGLSSGDAYMFPDTAPVTLQATSTSINDVNGGSHAWQLGVVGYDYDFNPVQDLFVLNGQTPVSGLLGASFMRITATRILTCGSANTRDPNEGTIYLSQTGTVTNLGVPVFGQIMYGMPIGSGLSVNVYTSLMGSDKALFYHIMGVSSLSLASQDIEGFISIKVRTYDSTPGAGHANTPWKEGVVIGISSSNPSINFDGSSYPSVVVGATSDRHITDVIITGFRTSGNSNNADVSAYLNGTQVEDAP